MKSMKNNRLVPILILNLLLFLYSFTGIMSKKAAGVEFLSFEFIVYYGTALLILVVYAIGWQQILKRVPLSTAYINKAITVFWGLLWGILFFGEQLTIGRLIGIVLIVVGIIIYMSDSDSIKRGEQ